MSENCVLTKNQEEFAEMLKKLLICKELSQLADGQEIQKSIRILLKNNCSNEEFHSELVNLVEKLSTVHRMACEKNLHEITEFVGKIKI